MSKNEDDFGAKIRKFENSNLHIFILELKGKLIFGAKIRGPKGQKSVEEKFGF